LPSRAEAHGLVLTLRSGLLSGSNKGRGNWKLLRQAGATARSQLVAAAADEVAALGSCLALPFRSVRKRAPHRPAQPAKILADHIVRVGVNYKFDPNEIWAN
jgi:hypothetical protein